MQSFEESVNNFQNRASSLIIASGLPIINGFNNKPIFTTVVGVLYFLAVIEGRREYKEIANCREYTRLETIYNEILYELARSSQELNFSRLDEIYLYYRYLLENNYLTLPENEILTGGKVKYCKKTLERPLSLNSHAIKNSNLCLLDDLIKKTSFFCRGKVKGKIIASVDITKETNNVPTNLDNNVTLEDKLNNLRTPSIYLNAIREGKFIYFLNPNDTEVYRKNEDNNHTLISNKGNIFKITDRSLEYSDLEEAFQNVPGRDLLEYKKFILSRIEEGKEELDQMKDEIITPRLKEAENIYKLIVK